MSNLHNEQNRVSDLPKGHDIYRPGVVLVGGVAGKSTKASFLLASGSVAYAVDIDYYMNMVNKAVPFVNAYDNVQLRSGVVSSVLQYLLRASDELSTTIALACSYTMLLDGVLTSTALQTTLSKHGIFINVTMKDDTWLLPREVQEMWRVRTKVTGHWQSKGNRTYEDTVSDFKRHGHSVERVASLLDVQIKDVNAVPAYVDAGLTAHILACSAIRLSEVLEARDVKFRDVREN